MTDYEPGPDLDAKVAELMGWTLYPFHDGDLWMPMEMRVSEWHPSTDIRDAMVVVEWMRGKPMEVCSKFIRLLCFYGNNRMRAAKSDQWSKSLWFLFMEPADICNAALEACDV